MIVYACMCVGFIIDIIDMIALMSCVALRSIDSLADDFECEYVMSIHFGYSYVWLSMSIIIKH